MSEKSESLRKEINNKIIDSLNKNNIPWAVPWASDNNSGFPKNITSKKGYSGINPLLLLITSWSRNYKSRWWGTYKQWQDLGLKVKKRPNNIPNGEWGTNIVFYSPFEVDETKKDGTVIKKKIFFLKSYTVFNAEQIEGEGINNYLPIMDNQVPNLVDLNFDAADEFIKSTGATITHGGNSAHYTRPFPYGSWPKHMSGDTITLPVIQHFFDTTEYYITAFHELAHWAEVRLDWEGTYEMGELIAEISACYLASELQIPNRNFNNHAKYLSSWLSKMKDDTQFIFKASTQASKVVDYLLSFKV